MKLLINSHVQYWGPLSVLLASLVNASFHRWSDVIVVFGGSRADVAPRRVYLPIVRDMVTIVNVTLNAFDYNGLSAVYHHRDHPLVAADSYLYLHDSAAVGGNFSRLYARHSLGLKPHELRKPQGYFSNVCVFGRGLVHRWTSTYDRNLTKAEAVRLEISGPAYDARGARPLVWWARGNITDLGQRARLRAVDPYHTGILRDEFWYPDFDVYKYVLAGRWGDITEGKTHWNNV